MQSIQVFEWRGFDMVDIIKAFNDPLKSAIWGGVVSHPLYVQFCTDEHLTHLVVTGKWLRKLSGHVAVDKDLLTDLRRFYPPINDKDLIFIGK